MQVGDPAAFGVRDTPHALLRNQAILPEATDTVEIGPDRLSFGRTPHIPH